MKFKLLSKFLFMIASIITTTSQTQCILWFLDEPKMPKSLIEK